MHEEGMHAPSSYHSPRTKPSNLGCQQSRPPPGPVALYVCRESRYVTLRRYTLGFGGCNTWKDPRNPDAEWEKRLYGKQRIWVDFERDTILLACITAITPYRSWLHLTGCLVHKLAKRCPMEVSKIQRLAIGGHWSGTPGRGGFMPFLYLRTHIDRGLGNNLRMIFRRMELSRFERLREFVVCDAWDQEGNVVRCLLPGWHGDGPWDENLASELVVKELGMVESRQVGRGNRIPSCVRVVRDLERLKAGNGSVDE